MHRSPPFPALDLARLPPPLQAPGARSGDGAQSALEVLVRDRGAKTVDDTRDRSGLLLSKKD